jgi:hypothetical protein
MPIDWFSMFISIMFAPPYLWFHMASSSLHLASRKSGAQGGEDDDDERTHEVFLDYVNFSKGSKAKKGKRVSVMH